MSHQVESMFFQHEVPWHGLGMHVDHAPTAEEAIQAAKLDWTVQPAPVYVRNPDGRYVAVSEDESQNHRAMRRDSDGAVLAIVGRQYTPLQNSEAFKFFDPFIASGHFEYETAGSLNGGRRVWVLAGRKDGIQEVVKGDPIKAFVLLSNTHDGSSPVITLNTGIRVVCSNTMAMANAEGKQIAKARHTRNVTWNVEQMQETMAEFNQVFQTALDQYRFLASAKMDEKAMGLFVRALFGKEAKDETLPRGGARIIELFSQGAGNGLPGVRGTMWAGYNAVTQYIDHERGGSDNVEKRLESAWFGQGADLKKKALELAISGAMVLKAA